jgi:hypothetical protein
MTEPRNITAICQFRGAPGREREAALAWAFELTYYFLRGVGEAPVVTYAGGIYTCTGLMTTTHPFDRDPTWFDKGSPWDLDYNTNSERAKTLRELYDQGGQRWDGRESAPADARS